MVDDSALRDLARRRGVAVTSLYLDVDGRNYPRDSDYEPHIDHLFRVARKSAASQGKLVVEAVERDLARISRWLGNGVDRTTTRGIAVFSCADQGLFETFNLPLPVRDQVVVAQAPDVAQLVSVLTVTERTLAVAVDKQRSRLLRLEGGAMEECDAPIDTIEHRVDTDIELGSFEHHHEELAREHSRRVARIVARELEEHPAKHLVLSGTQEVVRQLEEYLPQRFAALIAGTLSLPPTSSQLDLARAARATVCEEERKNRAALVTELHERASQGASAVVGIDATIESLEDRRARTVLVEQGFEEGGRRCPECARLVVRSEKCPRCGATTLAVFDVVSAVITEAFAQHVDLAFCEGGELAELGHIGSLERR